MIASDKKAFDHFAAQARVVTRRGWRSTGLTNCTHDEGMVVFMRDDRWHWHARDTHPFSGVASTRDEAMRLAEEHSGPDPQCNCK